MTEVIEALAAAGQAADMMTAALTEARAGSQVLAPARAAPAERLPPQPGAQPVAPGVDALAGAGADEQDLAPPG